MFHEYDHADNGMSDEAPIVAVQPPSSESTVTCDTDPNPSHIHLILRLTLSIPGYDDRIEDVYDNDIDSANAMDADDADADAFEMLSRGFNVSNVDPPRRGLAVERLEVPLPEILDDPGQPPIQIEAGGTETAPTVIIDHFPFGSPGAPIPAPHDISAANGPSLVAHGDSTWAPFRSRCDWEVAYWAKLNGPTSTAVTGLLAIPEVSGYLFLLILVLTCREGCRKARAFVSNGKRIECHDRQVLARTTAIRMPEASNWK